MKVHMHTKFCLICLLTFIFHHCNHCHEPHGHGPEGHHRHRHGPAEPEAGRPAEPDAAAHEKNYYIEKLFARYGENGRLSFFGLERLLTNLGLGEIKVVEINHEDLGHDHVSHLDVLAVQEGKHFHSHAHQHPRKHVSSGNQTASGGPAKRFHKCDPEKDSADAPAGPEDKHARDRGHRPCHHHCPRPRPDPNATRHPANDSLAPGERGEAGQAPSPPPDANGTQEHPEGRPPKGKRKRKGKTEETSEVITPGFPPSHAQGGQDEHNRVHKPDRAHGPGRPRGHLPERGGHGPGGHDPGHGHHDPGPDGEGEPRHTRKREAPHVKKSAIYSAASHKERSEDDRQHEVSRERGLLRSS